MLDLVADGLNKVGFAMTGISVNEKRIINNARLLDDGHGGGVSQLVEGADNKFSKVYRGFRLSSLLM